jgi:trehalose 6-phosphate phosphatase
VALHLRTDAGRIGLEALLAQPRHALVGYDYDGTLAPIVDDPSQAVAADGVGEALASLAAQVGRLAIITGRPAEQARTLGGFDTVPGLGSLVIVGHYGAQRWDAGGLTTIDMPAGLAEVREQLPRLLASHGLSDVDIEDKGLSTAIHVRKLPDPAQALDRLRGPLLDLAAKHGLVTEQGRMVVEIRGPGIDKGQALERLVAEFHAQAVVFVGDDLGDLAAYDAVDRLRKQGLGGLLVCSASDEVEELARRADLVVPGPAGVLELTRELTAMLAAR